MFSVRFCVCMCGCLCVHICVCVWSHITFQCLEDSSRLICLCIAMAMHVDYNNLQSDCDSVLFVDTNQQIELSEVALMLWRSICWTFDSREWFLMWPWWFEALLKFWFNRVVSEVALMVWSICWSFDSIEWFDVVEHLLLKLWFNRDFWSIYFWWIWRICWSFDCCNCVVETKAYGLFLALTFRDRFIRKRFCCTLWTQIPGPVVEKKERVALWKS